MISTLQREYECLIEFGYECTSVKEAVYINTRGNHDHATIHSTRIAGRLHAHKPKHKSSHKYLHLYKHLMKHTYE